MEFILNFLKSDMFLVILLGINLLLLILYITNSVKLSKIRKNYSKFMKKLGNGTNIEEILNTYIKRVDEVDNMNKEITLYCEKLDKDISKCIQKVGIVRYNAFKDVGSDLSFTLAILDKYNDGIVLNGIYSREMSNIYAKPIKNCVSQYTLSEEEKQAIQKAVNAIPLVE